MSDMRLTDRLRDLASQVCDQNILANTRFLSPAEQLEAKIWLKKNQVAHVFTGGYEGAERQVCFLLPDFMKPSDLAVAYLAEVVEGLLLITSAKSSTLSHRDYLGSLLGLGIKREQLGDFLIVENEATVLALTSMAAFIENHLERVGSLPVQIQRVRLQDITAQTRTFTTIRITVASLRLDKIAASGFGLSRTDVADQIRSRNVQVNWMEELHPDQSVPIGAVISLRGYGRIRLASEEGLSRKDRHILILEKYI